MSAVLEKPITFEEFMALPVKEQDRYEVLRGVLIEKMSPGRRHGQLIIRFGRFLDQWVADGDHGEIVTDVGFRLHRPLLDYLRPDIAFIRKERISEDDSDSGYWFGEPDVAIEVISPSERTVNSFAKVDEYLESGTSLVLTVWPESRKIVAHTPDGTTRTYWEGDSLSFPELPGFVCKVEDIFS